MGAEAPRFSIAFATRREGNNGFVVETIVEPDGERTSTEYGPMRAAAVPAFVDARRRLWFLRARRAGAVPVAEPEDFSYLAPSGRLGGSS